MTRKIKLLSQKEILKIAAGQVVDRPANVVKELIENSVDAGATKITVYIQDGGKELIRVVDNGCGMSKLDAKFCFTKHSTSKITNLDELSTGQATTFGFRGEALASISAISKVTLMTKDQESINGISLEVENGDFISEQEIPFEQGTDLKIKDLFYNTPARQKFLKKRESENRNITQLIQAFCLDYLDINFKLFIDNRQTINCPATDCIIKRAAQIWDHNFSQNLLLVGDKTTLEKQENINPETGEITNSGTVIYGAITNHQYYRYDRNNIFLFVNKRWVKNHEIQAALLKGYINVLPAAKYPAAFIFVETDPAQIDVNTHPRKEDVKFLHPRIITNKLQEIIKNALQENLSSQIKQPVNFKVEPEKQPSFWQANQNFNNKIYEKNITPAFEQFNFDTFLAPENNSETSENISSQIIYDPSINSLLRQSPYAKASDDIGYEGHAGQTRNGETSKSQTNIPEASQFGTKEFDTSKINANGPDMSRLESVENKNHEFYPSSGSGRTEEIKTFCVNKFNSSEINTSLFIKNEINTPENKSKINSQKQESQNNSQYTPEYASQKQIANQESINIAHEYNIIGQYKKTYILIEKENGLFFVDQHAAHERVLYEIFSKRFEDTATIRLLFPQLITLKEEDLTILEPNLSVFKQNGIEIEVFGETQVKIQATPVHIKNINLQELILEVISWIQEFQELDAADFFKKINEKMHAQMACKAAIKAGDILTIEQMEKLLQDLEITENRFACPHGRPTGWILTIDEIEKKFRRKL